MWTELLDCNMEDYKLGIWCKLLMLAGKSDFEGKICISERYGYSIEMLADRIKTNVLDLDKTIEYLIKNESIKVDKFDKIEIINWKHYQSEYQRQKKYRKRLQEKVTTKSNAIDRDRERDIDIDKETPIQTIINQYKALKGYDKIKDWDKHHYSRHSKPAKRLLDIFNNDIEAALKCLNAEGEKLNNSNKKEEWVIEWVINKTSEYLIKKQAEEAKQKEIDESEENLLKSKQGIKNGI